MAGEKRHRCRNGVLQLGTVLSLLGLLLKGIAYRAYSGSESSYVDFSMMWREFDDRNVYYGFHGTPPRAAPRAVQTLPRAAHPES